MWSSAGLEYRGCPHVIFAMWKLRLMFFSISNLYSHQLYTLQEGNACAHFLAKYGSSRNNAISTSSKPFLLRVKFDAYCYYGPPLSIM